MTLTLFHTAKLHETTFDTLRDRLALGAELHHVTRPDWLTRARAGDATVTEELAQTIGRSPGAVLCTCTTLGEVQVRFPDSDVSFDAGAARRSIGCS